MNPPKCAKRVGIELPVDARELTEQVFESIFASTWAFAFKKTVAGEEGLTIEEAEEITRYLAWLEDIGTRRAASSTSDDSVFSVRRLNLLKHFQTAST